MKKLPAFVETDSALKEFAPQIKKWASYINTAEKRLLGEYDCLNDFANGHHFFGLHEMDGAWVFREWAPNATQIYLVGIFNEWKEKSAFCFSQFKNGIWELKLPKEALQHGDLFKLSIHWNEGQGLRIPAYARRVVQDQETKLYSAQVWAPEKKYQWRIGDFQPGFSSPLIYECHVGMAGEEEKVSTYEEFRKNVLPRICDLGYNTIQLMAIQEHPYYGSFGYHVSNLFAPSSRFGTPEELKALVDEAHERGVAVIMDLVHSHSVKNQEEGLALQDGSLHQYFHSDHRREHPAWDSLCFDYGRPEVLHFLLSNCKYWLEEFKFDGFRFDGITSMIYFNHGLEQVFSSYMDYYSGGVDVDALAYLTMANKLIQEVNPLAITLAEEMSGLPGLAVPLEKGGYGFSYRLAMGIPDYWIKLIKEIPDENWPIGHIFYELTNHRKEEATISYAESHDQALVGDKTHIFRLIDREMYWHMAERDPNEVVARGIALHKMIRLFTFSTMNGGYLNFMGNEFGHPEWIDFPREGNNWSYKYARRQWSLADNTDLKYKWLRLFDQEMVGLLKKYPNLATLSIRILTCNEENQVLAFERGDLVFVFNFNPTHSFTDFGFQVHVGKFRVILSSDDEQFGGFGHVDLNRYYYTQAPGYMEKLHWLHLYIPARTAMVFERVAIKRAHG